MHSMRAVQIVAVVCVLFASSGCAVGAALLEPDASRRDANSVIDERPAQMGPCAESDGDRDGVGTDPSCAQKDCDDRNPAIFPGAPEACNRLDDDCDGMIDEELGEGSCGVGACRRSQPYCVDGALTACTPGAPSMEICNGLDDDCDGMTDEDVSGATCGVGACRRTASCTAGMLGACTPGAPSMEICNRIDDDCDGELDEGFRVAVVGSTYTALAGQHDGCTQSTRIGGACNAAIHRLCAARGCSTTGFGPLENSGDTAVIACVASDAVRSVPYATLTMHHSGCSASTERIGPQCNAAIHRYCASMGFVSGFGPLEQSADAATIACVRAPAAEVVSTTYTALSAQHGGCTQSSRIGSDCNAAIHRLCASRGASSGYGPVENSGDGATIVCVRP
jgi:hypothetical protein